MILEQKKIEVLVKQAATRGKIEWSAHALRRMMEREISRTFVLHVINYGEIIELYSDDKPFPSMLFWGLWKNEPLHVVAAYDPSLQKIFVVTAYRPDKKHFEADFKKRKKDYANSH